MKTLDLNAYGVEEISKPEEVEVNGGFWFGLIFGILVAEMLDRSAQSDYEEGRSDASNFWRN